MEIQLESPQVPLPLFMYNEQPQPHWVSYKRQLHKHASWKTQLSEKEQKKSQVNEDITHYIHTSFLLTLRVVKVSVNCITLNFSLPFSTFVNGAAVPSLFAKHVRNWQGTFFRQFTYVCLLFIYLRKYIVKIGLANM